MSNCERDRTIPHKLRTDALGQVTAGIVHDANNALAVAVWNIERAARGVDPSTKEADSAKAAINSAMKAAGFLRRILDFAGHAAYDPDLVNMNELLGRLFAGTQPGIQNDISVRYERGVNVGATTADETLLELSLLDAVASLTRRMAAGGTLVIRASETSTDETMPGGGEIVVSLLCAGLQEQDLPASEMALARYVAELAGGRLTIAASDDGRCEVRLSLPRAVSSSANGVVYS